MSDTIKYESHPAADLFPLMEGQDFAGLVANIKAHGLREPIALYEGQILDGRNRYRACLDAGVEPRFEEWQPRDGESPIDYVISLNIWRRHLNESQRAMIGAMAEPMYALEAKKRQGTRTDLVANLPQGENGKARDLAAKQVNVSPRSVQSAKKVLVDGAPELVAAVEHGAVRVSTAAKLATLPKKDQTAVVKQGPAAIRAATAPMPKPKAKTPTEPHEEGVEPEEEDYSDLDPQGKRSALLAEVSHAISRARNLWPGPLPISSLVEELRHAADTIATESPTPTGMGPVEMSLLKYNELTHAAKELRTLTATERFEHWKYMSIRNQAGELVEMVEHLDGTAPQPKKTAPAPAEPKRKLSPFETRPRSVHRCAIPGCTTGQRFKLMHGHYYCGKHRTMLLGVASGERDKLVAEETERLKSEKKA